jgi:predicted DNA-binding transcriptional regulator YafY
LAILLALQARGRTSAAALAAEFEVSQRTILRDMDHLSAAGVPVFAERGREGGFALLEGYRTRLTGLSDNEAEVVALMGLGSIAGDLGLGARLSTAQRKLLASLPGKVAARAQRVAEKVHLDPVNWYERGDDPNALPLVTAALWSDRKIAIEYASWKAKVARTLNPLGLVLKAGHWYLVASEGTRPRIYRVNNIEVVRTLDRLCVRPRGFDLRAFWEERSRAFEKELLKETARIRISPRGRRLLRSISVAASERLDVEFDVDLDSWIEACIPIESVEHAAGQFLRLGNEVEVIEPLALRERIVREHKAAVALYRSARRTR